MNETDRHAWWDRLSGALLGGVLGLFLVVSLGAIVPGKSMTFAIITPGTTPTCPAGWTEEVANTSTGVSIAPVTAITTATITPLTSITTASIATAAAVGGSGNAGAGAVDTNWGISTADGTANKEFTSQTNCTPVSAGALTNFCRETNTVATGGATTSYTNASGGTATTYTWNYRVCTK